LLLAAVAFFALAIGTGSTATSLLILGPISTFALPAVAVIAFWWNDWPGTRLTPPLTGLTDTVLAAAAAIALTIAGQAILERPDIRAVFDASRAPGLPVTFPATLPLAGDGLHRHAPAVTSMRTLATRQHRPDHVRDRRARPVLGHRDRRLLPVHQPQLPACRPARRVAQPAGRVPRPDFGSALIAVGVWQAVLYIGLHGWPITAITRRPVRLLAGNTLVISLGTLTYLALRDLAHWAPDAIGAACGCLITAVLIVAMLFDNWPAVLLRPAAGRALTLALTALTALVLNRALTAYGGSVHWTRATPDDWVTTAALSFAGAGIILHTGIGLRWPFHPKTPQDT
jgi:hypothetical protein